MDSETKKVKHAPFQSGEEARTIGRRGGIACALLHAGEMAKCRIKTGLEIDEAAQLIGISCHYLCRIESGRATFGPKADWNIAREIYGDLCVFNAKARSKKIDAEDQFIGEVIALNRARKAQAQVDV